MKASAVIDGCYRTELRRQWAEGLPFLVVCMLNPSTADASKNDPTILTLVDRANRWGYGGIIVVNLFAFRSSSPAEMRAAPDPVGAHVNTPAIDGALFYAQTNTREVLCAWGTGGKFRYRDEWFLDRCRSYGVKPVCLGVTADGSPKHPLARGLHRIPRDQALLPWPREATLAEKLEGVIQAFG